MLSPDASQLGNVESLVMQAMAKLRVDDLFSLLGVKEFYLPNVLHQLLPGVCRTLPTWCNFVNDLLSGPTTYLVSGAHRSIGH